MPQRGDRVFPSRDELLGDEAGVASFEDRLHYGGVVDLLSLIELTSTGIPGSVVMSDEIFVLPNDV